MSILIAKNSPVKRFFVFVLILPFLFVSFGFSKPDILKADEVRLPVLMYHNVLKCRTGKYIVSPSQVEDDFIALQKAGYTGVHMRDVIDWMDGKSKLPAKPVVITFDDGHYNNMHYVLPLAKKYNMKFMINPVTSFSKFTTDSNDHSNPNYSHLTWSQMKELHDSGMVEIGNHTHAMHKYRPRFGILKMESESKSKYLENLRTDVNKANDLIEASGVPRPTTFAYPFGKYDKSAKETVLEMGFRALLTCTEGVTTIKKGKQESLHNIRRYNRDGDMKTEEIMKLVERKA